MRTDNSFAAVVAAHIKKERWGFLLSCTIITVRSIILLVPSLITQVLIDEVLGNNEYGRLWQLCLILILIPVVSACSIYIDQFFLKGLIRAANASRQTLIEGLIFRDYQEQKKYDNSGNAFLVCDMVNDLAGKMFNGTANVVWCIFTVLTGIVFCMFQNIPLTLYLLAITLLDGWIVKRVAKYYKQTNKNYLEHAADRAAFFRDTEAAIKEIRMQGCEKRFYSVYEKLLGKEVLWDKKQQEISQLSTLIGELADALVYVGIYAGGTFLVIKGRCTAGNLVALGSLYDSIFMPIHMLSGMFLEVYSIKNVVAKLEKIFFPYQKKPEQQAGEVKSLELKDVSFGYEGKGVLSYANIRVEKGIFVFLAGESGSGKSTICDLMLGLFKSQEGSLLINGTIDDIAKYRKKIHYVSQKSLVISGTVRENLLYGLDINVSDEEMKQVLMVVNLASWFMNLQEGLDAMCENEGFTLSGGEKQRLCLARALLGNPDILILDEALSAVDAESAFAILDNLKKEKKDRGILYISHNLNLCSIADVVYNLEEGKLKRTEQNGSIL